ncbi:transcriptional regulatory protein [Mycobacterium lentiflavum]|uniref:MarR family transcriptional regulator n=1 Tax=Mycobacterium lentiflavum TaxID=141349 RepID=A0A0E3WB83_MYCLN|nr:MarR family transcriptional regulator [Mycobacterium lentiflavum]MEE3065717.1 MarR family transcriptional regulator [Actinomycetota bacterium]ULP42939.1 MarR family transcriptional regulator [Mycobacterium lentiflavum]CQD04552.1 transcriptional regulatory protein [Mycobacterium lentiflavum]
MSACHDEPLGFLLYRVVSSLRPQMAAELTPLGLGLPEFVCMRILSERPGLTSAELARGTHVSAQAANQVLRALEERGALSRRAGIPAGRAMPAQLTRRGKALLKRADAAVQRAEERILTRLTPEQQGQLKELLHAAGTP